MDNNLSRTGRIKEFDFRNGGDSVVFKEWIYYANGASRDMWPEGALMDPPLDAFQRLTNIVYFHQARLNKAVAEFDAFKEQLMMAAFPDPRRLDQLRTLQTVVSERNAALEVARRNLAATPEALLRESIRHSEAENQVQMAEFANRVREISV